VNEWGRPRAFTFSVVVSALMRRTVAVPEDRSGLADDPEKEGTLEIEDWKLREERKKWRVSSGKRRGLVSEVGKMERFRLRILDWEEESVSEVLEDCVEGAGGFGVGDGFFFAQRFEILVVLDFRLQLQEFLIRQDDELLAAVFFDDLRVDAHGGRIPFDEGYDTQ